jgi:hypothetical protein
MLADLVQHRLPNAKRILLAGCGGGYDILGAIPLVHELRGRSIDVHLASLSFCYLNGLDRAQQDSDHPNLYGVSADAATERAYCPEAWLASFLDREYGTPHTIWSFDKTGVRPLAAAYRALADRLSLDAIILIDGGIDAILRGDEVSLGTPSEDLTSLAAATALEIPILMACVGLSAELRDGIAHAQVFERMSELARQNAYAGASALVPGFPSTDVYLRGVEYVFANQQLQKRSHVHHVITRSTRGDFGQDAPHVWLSPLASMYWLFDAHVVARTHLFLDLLRPTDTIWEVAARVEGARKDLAIRTREAIPL